MTKLEIGQTWRLTVFSSKKAIWARTITAANVVFIRYTEAGSPRVHACFPLGFRRWIRKHRAVIGAA